MSHVRFCSLIALVFGLTCVVPVNAEMLFEDSFESGVISEDQWIIDTHKECEISVDRTISRSGQASARFDAGYGARCEILPWFYSNFITGQLREPYGEDRWYSFSVYLEDDWEYNDRNEVVAQWHASKDVFLNEPGGRGPPLALRILGDVWRITYGWDADFSSKKGAKAIYPLWVGPIEPGRWTDWVFRVRWTRGDDDGLVQVWKNGEMIADRAGPIGYNDIRGTYLKLGSYHPRTERTLYIDEVRVGDQGESFETMSPRSNDEP